jgi:probable rRNA maturation factor
VFGKGVRATSLPLSRPRLRRLIVASLPARCASAEIALVVLGAAEAKQLNKKFRQKDYATNILTFDYRGLPHVQADLVICHPVVVREANAAGKPLDHHYAHLILHGVLHACGMDHQSDRDAQRMEALEITLLQRFRIPNPYTPVAR